MSRNVREMRCSPEAVFRVLADGWLFPAWVVGASRMRRVADAWPKPGSHLRHSFGVWPLLIDDSTSVIEYDPPHRMVLQARGWPIGEARVSLEVKPRTVGDAPGCVVRIDEVATAGPGSVVPQPLLDLPLRWRNVETLRRLAYLAEGGAGR